MDYGARKQRTSYLLISAISSSIDTSPGGGSSMLWPCSACDTANDRRELRDGRPGPRCGLRAKDVVREFMILASRSWSHVVAGQFGAAV